MQLSTSVARTLGLNEILCEAIALGHDLGHTPFGHAGEEALDLAFSQTKFTPKIKSFAHFTHYEQGADVVSYAAERDPNSFGLSLSIEVLEGILKHTAAYDRDDKDPKSLDNILALSKYKTVRVLSKWGSPESQVVRICDKISYMISDLEDGMSIGALHWDDIRDYDILKSAEPEMGEDEYAALKRNRSDILREVVDSLLSESKGLLSREKRNKGSSLRPSKVVIKPSPGVRRQMDGIYHKLEKPFLFKNIHVERSNRRAKHIVSCLFCTFLRYPELLPWHFRSRYRNIGGKKSERLRFLEDSLYRMSLDERIKIDTYAWHRALNKPVVPCLREMLPKSARTKKRLCDIIAAKDYVSGMTDNFAEECMRQFVSCSASRDQWHVQGYDEWEIEARR
jgi:dGTPase